MSDRDKRVVLFSDIRDFSSLTAKIGDRGAYQLVKTFVRLVEEQVERHEGEVIKTYGDGIMTTFPALKAGLQGSVDMQRALKDHNETHPESTISAGSGLHTGDVIRDDGDIFGHAVNLTARLANYAKGGQIITSSEVHGESVEYDGYDFLDLNYHEFKGIGRERIYELLWRSEVGRLETRDDELILVLTEDHLGIELSKDIQNELKKARDELRREARGESGLAKFLLEKMEKLFDRYLSRYIDRALLKKGIGLEHPVEKVELKFSGGELEVFIEGKRTITLTEDNVDIPRVEEFVSRFQKVRETEKSAKNHKK